MATKVQSKTYFPGSMMDLNNGFCNSMWDPYHDDRASASEKSQCYNSFMMMQAMDGYSGYAKEQMRQTILKQDSIFRHQLEELHRLYKRQRDLMSELTMKEHCNFSMPLKDYTPLNSKSSTNQRRVIDLELPADVYEDNEGKPQFQKNVHKLADLNEPIHMEEAPNSNSELWYLSKVSQQREIFDKKELSYNNGTLQGDPKKPVEHLSKKRTIFGVELCERSNTPVDSSQNLEKKLPPWLMMKPNLCNEQPKGKETTIYQMNMDSLQHHSHQFFKKSEITKLQTDNHHQSITKILGVSIVNCSQSHDQNALKENGKNNLRDHIDLNLSFDEEEAPSSTPYIPESVVKIATMEIDLEAPATLESETDTPSTDEVFMDADEDLVKVAAEAMMSMSSSEPPPPPEAADTLLRWFAEVIASGNKKDPEELDNDKEFIIPEGMDYLEYMTLKIKETKEEYICYKPIEEDDVSLLRKRTTRKGQGKRGRQRKDFQRDVLPGIVSLSRREVTEDIQTFEEAFTGIGVSWQSKRKVSGKNGRGRRRLVASDPSSQTPPPPPPPPSPPVEVVEQSVCREEKSLSGWGKRTRRLPRQRCQNNGGNHQSLALKC
ncbi:uncharacterized protein LOC111920059 [Lactuca sativa]|uniref:Uncharacterized protein n=1 Tax=Lactuca sativa TaxID=4236 RepID=A0A9R1XW02_LACSA|nr:uncharacterized protein LOC111920059 [Lactuca sativa]KAJ0221387.1 hypothetical protein LSAT_V11C200082590 [Lactuca sativa]